MKRVALTLLAVLALPSVSVAQTAHAALSPVAEVLVMFTAEAQAAVPNPTEVFFTAPPDHATTTNYVVEVYRQSDMTLTGTPQNLGKPTPNAQNKIVGPLSKVGLANNVLYVVKIVQVNPIGSTGSATASGPFIVGAMPVGVSGIGVQ